MIIQQHRILSLKGKLGSIKKGANLVLGVRLVPDMMPKLQRIGFPDSPSVGDAVLPAVIGPKTRFNANGGVTIHRDQPKETAYRQVEWHWTEFRGRDETVEMSDIRDVPYERYPRSQIPPPSIELQIAVAADGQRVLVTPQMTFASDDDKQLILAVNMLLEAFGFCEVFDSDLGSIIQAPLRRLNWKLLQPGHRAWTQLRPDILRVIELATKGNQPVIEHRLELINRYAPDFVAIGLAGFAGYAVFGFTQRKLFVFESIYSGNATYVFGDNWERLSRFTKCEVLDNRLHTHRFLHRDGWNEQISGLLDGERRGGRR